MIEPQNHIVYLSVRTWRGSPMVLGTHYYGSLHGEIEGEHKSVEVERTLTAEEAAELTAESCRFDNGEDEFGKYEEGDQTTRFLSLRRLKEAAADQYKESFPEAVVLLYGDHIYREPMFILDGPNGLSDDLNPIVAQCEKLGWWDKGNDTEVKGLCKRWELLLDLAVRAALGDECREDESG